MSTHSHVNWKSSAEFIYHEEHEGHEGKNIFILIFVSFVFFVVLKVSQTSQTSPTDAQIACKYFKMNHLRLKWHQVQSYPVKVGQTDLP